MDSSVRTGLCVTAATVTGFVKPLGWLYSASIGFICGKLEADDKYKQLIPLVRATIGRFGRDSQEANAVLDLLGELPSFGACRANFKKHYIDNREGWRSLPDESKDLPFGFWY